MTDSCLHQSATPQELPSYCVTCGSIQTSSVNSLKPKKYNHLVEIDPRETLKIIQSSSKIINTKSPCLLEYLPKRTDLIKYLRQITKRNYLKEQTFNLSILLMDIILTNHKDLKYDLVGVACLILACKFDEDDAIVPEFSDIQAKDSKLYLNVKEIQQYETICLKLLDYKVNYFSAFVCLEMLLSNGIYFEKEIPVMNLKFQISLMEKIEAAYQICYNVLNFFIADLRSLEYRPEHIAFSIVCISRQHFKVKQKWPNALAEFYNVKFEDFEDCYYTINK